jgi:hypothetical protein
MTDQTRDPLDDLTAIVAGVDRRQEAADERGATELAEGRAFHAAFDAACATTVRPAMEAAVARLRAAGADGVVQVHPGGEARFRTPRIVLWLSLDGPLVGIPREDRNPYLQLEADVAEQRVQVDEGDAWHGGGGGRSGRVATWTLDQVTTERITTEIVAVARRAAA